jgi:hypothetical protein
MSDRGRETHGAVAADSIAELRVGSIIEGDRWGLVVLGGELPRHSIRSCGLGLQYYLGCLAHLCRFSLRTGFFVLLA